MQSTDYTSSTLKNLRGHKTLKEVADAIGVTPTALSYYENGKRSPRDSIKVALADYYEKTVQEIFFNR